LLVNCANLKEKKAMAISKKTVSINCDSVYKNKHYKLELEPIYKRINKEP